MRIDPHETLAGVPTLRIRDLMRWMHCYRSFVTKEDISNYLQITQAETDALVAELLGQRMIVQSDKRSRDGQPWYQLAEVGARMAVAKATKPLKRSTAERLLAEFQARIQPINQDSYFLYRVSRVVLFGSYLSDAPTLGDIDLIVHLEAKESDHERHKELCVERNHEFLYRGWSVSWETMYAFYDELPRREVLVALRKKSSYISIHSIRDEVIIENRPHKVLFGPQEYTIPEQVRSLFGRWDDAEETATELVK